jgi:hypothetical protein
MKCPYCSRNPTNKNDYCSDHLISSDEREAMAAKLHAIYQEEARRQGDVRHKDSYADLPENIKNFDRVLADYVLELLRS